MKIFVDSKQHLNYHPLVVYFMLQPKDFEAHKERIEKLNDYKGFTRGIFKFRAIERGDQYCNELDEQLVKEISKYNVILRLIDDNEGNFNYALGKMNFNQDPSLFEASLQKFIVEACKHNVKALNSQLKNIGDSEETAEHKRVLTTLTLQFQKAISLKGFKRDVLRKLLDPTIDVQVPSFDRSVVFDESDLCDIPDDIRVKSKAFRELLSDHQSKEFDKIMALVEQQLNSPSAEESDKYASETAGSSKTNEMTLDYKSRVKPDIGPDSITITIAKVTTGSRGAKAWGIEITIDGETIPVHITNTKSRVLYFATLFKHIAGKKLNRSLFTRELDDPEVKWLRNIAETADPNYLVFHEWFETLRNVQNNSLNTAKTQADGAIKKTLQQKQYADALYYCTLQLDTATSSYYINLPAKNIIIPKDFVRNRPLLQE